MSKLNALGISLLDYQKGVHATPEDYSHHAFGGSGGTFLFRFITYSIRVDILSPYDEPTPWMHTVSTRLLQLRVLHS